MYAALLSHRSHGTIPEDSHIHTRHLENMKCDSVRRCFSKTSASSRVLGALYVCLPIGKETCCEKNSCKPNIRLLGGRGGGGNSR
jgi:hypothetical protein